MITWQDGVLEDDKLQALDSKQPTDKSAFSLSPMFLSRSDRLRCSDGGLNNRRLAPFIAVDFRGLANTRLTFFVLRKRELSSSMTNLVTGISIQILAFL